MHGSPGRACSSARRRKLNSSGEVKDAQPDVQEKGRKSLQGDSGGGRCSGLCEGGRGSGKGDEGPQPWIRYTENHGCGGGQKNATCEAKENW